MIRQGVADYDAPCRKIYPPHVAPESISRRIFVALLTGKAKFSPLFDSPVHPRPRKEIFVNGERVDGLFLLPVRRAVVCSAILCGVTKGRAPELLFGSKGESPRSSQLTEKRRAMRTSAFLGSARRQLPVPHKDGRRKLAPFCVRLLLHNRLGACATSPPRGQR